jgi:muconolactone delta-isomerase
MRFLVEIDHVASGQPRSPDASRAFIEDIIVPTLAGAEQLAHEGRIVAGGPVAGRIALRFIADVATVEELDRLVTGLPLWTVATTRVTPLIGFDDRRAHVAVLLQRLPET